LSVFWPTHLPESAVCVVVWMGGEGWAAVSLTCGDLQEVKLHPETLFLLCCSNQ